MHLVGNNARVATSKTHVHMQGGDRLLVADTAWREQDEMVGQTRSKGQGGLGENAHLLCFSLSTESSRSPNLMSLTEWARPSDEGAFIELSSLSSLSCENVADSSVTLSP